METVAAEDLHFYIDYAPPEDVYKVLRCLNQDCPMTVSQIFDALEAQGTPVKSRRSEILRRVFDLGLTEQSQEGPAVVYTLTSVGTKLSEVGAFEPELLPDLLHYLHYSSYNRQDLQSRKYLWSYRQCSIIAWHRGRMMATKEMASEVQALMMEEFDHLDFAARVGMRFDSTAVTRWKDWVMHLSPLPFGAEKGNLQKRYSTRHELAALALDDLYRHRHYRYGDPVVIDEILLDEVSRTFFLDPVCCRELLDLASRLINDIKLNDTFAGTSVTLKAPYTIERI
jgi:hypothetical protein